MYLIRRLRIALNAGEQSIYQDLFIAVKGSVRWIKQAGWQSSIFRTIRFAVAPMEEYLKSQMASASLH